MPCPLRLLVWVATLLSVPGLAQTAVLYQDDGSPTFNGAAATHLNTEYSSALRTRRWSDAERAGDAGFAWRLGLNGDPITTGSTVQFDGPAVPGLSPLFESDGGVSVNKATVGLLGGALSFASTDLDRIRLLSAPADLVAGANALTFAAWVMITTPLQAQATLLDLGGVAGTTRVGVAIEGLTLVARVAPMDGPPFESRVAVRFEPGLWHHLAVVIQLAPSNSVAFYFNGRVIDEVSVLFGVAAMNMAASDRAQLGRALLANSVPDGGFDGQLDEVALWKRALSQGEVRQLVQRQRGQYGGGAPARFVSRPMGGVPGTRWNSFSWTPRAPYGRDLFDIQHVENEYFEGNVSMATNVLLLRFNDLSLRDSSGRSHNGRLVSASAAGAYLVAGKFNAGLHLDRPDYVLVSEVATHPDFDFGTGDFTWAVWARTSACSANNQVVVGSENAGPPRGVHFWMGGACGNQRSRAIGVLYDSDGVGRTVFSNTRLDDGLWHHLVLVKSGHNPGALRLYVDGEVNTVSTAYTGVIDFKDELYLGQFPGLGYPSDVDVDELAVWRRALTLTEVSAAYRRGALRLKVQVRSCPTASCAGVSFVGPDGGTQSDYSSLAALIRGPPALGAPFPLAVPVNPYFQYSVEFETDTSEYTPELTEVVVFAALPEGADAGIDGGGGTDTDAGIDGGGVADTDAGIDAGSPGGPDAGRRDRGLVGWSCGCSVAGSEAGSETVAWLALVLVAAVWRVRVRAAPARCSAASGVVVFAALAGLWSESAHAGAPAAPGVNPYLEAAEQLHRALDYEVALRTLEDAKAWSGNTPALEVRIALAEGQLCAELQKTECALAAFQRGLTIDPTAELPRATTAPKILALFAQAGKALPKSPEAGGPGLELPGRVVLGARGLADVVGRTLGAALQLGLSWKGWCANVAAIWGTYPALGFGADVSLGTSLIRPRFGVRGVWVPGVAAIGAGPLAGADLMLPGRFSVALDAQVAFFAAPPPFMQIAVYLCLGLGFDLVHFGER